LFLRHLKGVLPGFDGSTNTLMSDRDNGLQSADSELQHVQRAFCVQHIADNVQKWYGIEVQKKFVAPTLSLKQHRIRL